MKPFSRVVVLDDEKNHLDIIVRALGKAGFGAIPYHFNDGTFTPEINEPCTGVRLVFSDIHLTPTSQISGVDYVSTLGRFLKATIQSGPYGLIFWSKHSEDEAMVVQDLKDRANDLGIQLPVFFGFIDKKSVLIGTGEETEEVDPDTSPSFKDLILSEINKCSTLKAVMEWEERAFLAANFVSNNIFELSKDIDPKIQEERWLGLISYLAQEAVGSGIAKQDPMKAIDNALLPILEDQFRYSLPNETSSAFDKIKEKLSGRKLKLPNGVSAAKLHSFYLVENLLSGNGEHQSRGAVSTIESEKIDQFLENQFASDWITILKEEFIFSNFSSKLVEIQDSLNTTLTPCLIALSPECDDVQGKVVTHRYLLGVLADKNHEKFVYDDDNRKLARNALHMIGAVEHSGKEKLLIASCRRFLAIPKNMLGALPLKSAMRLRRTTIDELSHHYTTYTRRPGVMRFS